MRFNFDIKINTANFAKYTGTMKQKVVTIRMSVGNNTVVGHTERDFIDHTELNKVLDEGWQIVSTHEAVASDKDGSYTAITFILEKE